MHFICLRNVPVILNHLQVTIGMVGGESCLPCPPYPQCSRSRVQGEYSSVSRRWQKKAKHHPRSLSLCLGNKWCCMAELPVMWMNEQATTAWHVAPAFVWCCSWVPQQWRWDGIYLPDEGNRGKGGGASGVTQSLISPFTAPVIYSICQSAPPLPLSVSLKYWHDGSLHPQGRGGKI